MASDSQVELPPGVEGLTGPHAIGPAVETNPDRADRREMFLALADKYRSEVASTWLNSEQKWTREPPPGCRGIRRQIDHICVSRGCKTRSVISSLKLVKSDHRPVFTLIEGMEVKARIKPWLKSYRGWRLDGPAALEDFRNGVAEGLGIGPCGTGADVLGGGTVASRTFRTWYLSPRPRCLTPRAVVEGRPRL